MEQTYTVNNLIQLIYGECNLFERLEIEHAISEDEALRTEYLMLKSSYRKLPKVTFRPSGRAISNILNFARDHKATA